MFLDYESNCKKKKKKRGELVFAPRGDCCSARRNHML